MVWLKLCVMYICHRYSFSVLLHFISLHFETYWCSVTWVNYVCIVIVQLKRQTLQSRQTVFLISDMLHNTVQVNHSLNSIGWLLSGSGQIKKLLSCTSLFRRRRYYRSRSSWDAVYCINQPSWAVCGYHNTIHCLSTLFWNLYRDFVFFP